MPRLWQQKWKNARRESVVTHHINRDDITEFHITFNRGCSDRSNELTADGRPSMEIVSMEHFNYVADSIRGRVIR